MSSSIILMKNIVLLGKPDFLPDCGRPVVSKIFFTATEKSFANKSVSSIFIAPWKINTFSSGVEVLDSLVGCDLGNICANMKR
jgi:hypothetical protein